MKRKVGFLRFLCCLIVSAVMFIATACGGGGGLTTVSNPPSGEFSGGDPARQMQELAHVEPTSIGDVTAMISDDAKVVISWEDTSPNEDGFEILKDGKKVANVDRNVAFWTDPETKNGDKYCYQIVAFNKEWRTFSEKKCFSIFMPEIVVIPDAFVVEGCDRMRGGVSFGGRTYLIWFESDSRCIGPEKSYLSVFSSDRADAVEETRIELNMSFPSAITISGDVIYIGGTLNNVGVLAALNQDDLTLKWELKLSDIADIQAPSSINGIAADQDSIFTTGDIASDQAGDVITIRFDLDGNYIWSEQWGTSCYDWGQYIIFKDGGIDVHVQAGQLCMIMSPDTPAPAYQGSVILHYNY